jgi:hypothetical protein
LQVWPCGLQHLRESRQSLQCKLQLLQWLVAFLSICLEPQLREVSMCTRAGWLASSYRTRIEWQEYRQNVILFYFHLPGPTDSFVVQHAGNGLQPGSAHGCKWMSHPPPTAQASCGPPAFHSIPFSCSVLATLLRPDSADAVRPQLRSNTCQETNLSMSQISGASTTASCLCTYVALSTAARYSADPSSRGQFSPGSSDKSYATGVGKME